MAGIKLAASLTRIIRRVVGGGGGWPNDLYDAPIPGDEFYIEQIAGTNKARMFVLSSYVAGVPGDERFRVGAGQNSTADPTTDSTRAWVPSATGVGPGGLWESLDFGAAFIDVTVYGRGYVYPEGNYAYADASTSVTDGVLFNDVTTDVPEFTVDPFLVSITNNDDGTHTMVTNRGTVTGTPTPTWDISAVGELGTDFTGDVVDNADGTYDLTVPSLVDIRTVSWMFTATNTEGEAVGTLDVDVPALEVPDQMAAPTLTGGAGVATLDFAADPDDNGSTITGWAWEIAHSTDTGFTSVVADGVEDSSANIDIDLAPETYIARAWTINEAGPAIPSDPSSSATVTALAYTVAMEDFSRDRVIFDSGMARSPSAATIIAEAGTGRTSVASLVDFDTNPHEDAVFSEGYWKISVPVTLEDYQFVTRVSLLPGSEGSTVSNNLFTRDSSSGAAQSFMLTVASANVTVSNNEFDGGGDLRYCAKGISLVGAGVTFEDNIVKNIPEDTISFAGSPNAVIQRNLFEYTSQMSGPEHPEGGAFFVNGLTYDTGMMCMYGGAKRVFEAAQDGVTSTPPSTATSNSDWTYTGVSDPHSDMFQVTRNEANSGDDQPLIYRNVWKIAKSPNLASGPNSYLWTPNPSAPSDTPMDHMTYRENVFWDQNDNGTQLARKFAFGNKPDGIKGYVTFERNILLGVRASFATGNAQAYVRWSDGNLRANFSSEAVAVWPNFSENVNQPLRQWNGHASNITFTDTLTNAASIPREGTSNAPEGSVIEARALNDTSEVVVDWTDVGTVDSEGDVTSTFPVPRSTEWLTAEYRVKGATSVNTLTNRFGAGHIWAYWEQSNTARLLDNDSLATRATVNSPNDVQIVRYSGALVDVNDEASTSDVSPAFIDIANAFSATRPGEKLRILWHAKPEYSPEDALTTEAEDATYSTGGGRDWDDELAIHETGTADGQQVGMVFDTGWISTFSGAGNTPNLTNQLFLGHDLDGTPCAKEEYVNSPVSGLPRLFPASEGGIYDYTYSKFAWAGPHGRFNNIEPRAASSITTISDYSLFSDDIAYNTMIGRLVDYMGSAANTGSLPYTGQTSGADRGTSDRAHFAQGNDGRNRFARIQFFHAMQTTGLLGVPTPVLNYRMDEETGAYADFAMLGYDLTTERRRRNATGTLGSMPATIPSLSTYGASIDPADDHRTEVMGWYINGQPAKRAEIVEGAGPNGEDICRVWPNEGSFDSSDLVIYGYGSFPGYFVEEDSADMVWANWLVADVGQPDEFLLAMPVQPQGGRPLPSTLPVIPSFTVAGTTAFNGSNAGVTVGTGKASMRVECIGAFNSTGDQQGIWNAHTDNIQFYILANGKVVVAPNGVSNWTTTSLAVSWGVTHEIVIVFNKSTGSASVTIDGTTESTSSFGTTGNLTGTARNPQFLQKSGGTNRAVGTFQSLKMWWNDPTGSGAAFKTIAGNAATVNADSWKVGSDAT